MMGLRERQLRVSQTHGLTSERLSMSHVLTAQTMQWGLWNNLTSSREATERKRRNRSPPLFEELSNRTKTAAAPVLVQGLRERLPVLVGEPWDTVSPSLEKQHRGRQPGVTAPADRSCGPNKGISQVASSQGLPLTSRIAWPKILSFTDPH